MLIHHKKFEQKWVARHLHCSLAKQAETFPVKPAVSIQRPSFA